MPPTSRNDVPSAARNHLSGIDVPLPDAQYGGDEYDRLSLLGNLVFMPAAYRSRPAA